MRVWPRSLAGRTATILILALVVVQLAGLSIYSKDRAELQRLADGRDLGTRVAALYRAVVAQPPEAWAGVVRDAEAPAGERYAIEPAFPSDALGPASPADQRLIRPYSRSARWRLRCGPRRCRSVAFTRPASRSGLVRSCRTTIG